MGRAPLIYLIRADPDRQRANRDAKPLSRDVNFGCAKLFITTDNDVFKSGLQIERGYAQGPVPYPGCLLKRDWDWHRLVRQCAAGTVLDRELRRLVKREGFVAEVGDWEANAVFNGDNFKSARQIRNALGGYSRREWMGFQLYYPMTAAEVRLCTGYELVKAIFGVFAEVLPAMNACMQVSLTPAHAPMRLGEPITRKVDQQRSDWGGRRG
jgi:hypothetical protein